MASRQYTYSLSYSLSLSLSLHDRSFPVNERQKKTDRERAHKDSNTDRTERYRHLETYRMFDRLKHRERETAT